MRKKRWHGRFDAAALCLIASLLVLVGDACQRSDSTDTAESNRHANELPRPIPSPVDNGGMGKESSHEVTGKGAKTDLVAAAKEPGTKDASHASQQRKAETQSDVPSEFVVKVRAAEPEGGIVKIALFDNEDSYQRREDPLRATERKAVDGECTWRLKDLPPGQFAVAAFQDKNGNGELDTGSFGIPLEPYGFSNHPERKMRPPSYDQAKVDHQGVATEVVVVLR